MTAIGPLSPRAAAAQAAVHRALDAVRSSGIPKPNASISAETGLSVETVNFYARVYLHGINAELLGREVRDGDAFLAWKALYRSFLTQIVSSPDARMLQSRYLRLAIESLDRAGHSVTCKAIVRLASAGMSRAAAALRAWEAETGRTATRVHWRTPVTLDMVLPLIDPALHRMPFTFLDDPCVHRPLTESSLRMISGLKQPKLRDTAFLCLATEETNLRNDVRLFGLLAEHLPALGLTDIDGLVPDAFYPALHDGRILPEISAPTRVYWLQTYFGLLRKQKTYFERLSPGQARDLAPFRLRPVTSTSFWERSQLNRQLRDESQDRRKAAAAAVHDKFYLFRNIAQRRLNQLVRLRQAFREACDRTRANGSAASFPVSFVYSEEAVTSTGSSRTVTHRFRLWDGHALRRAHAPVAPE